MKKFRDIKEGDSIFLIDWDELDIREGSVFCISPFSSSRFITFYSNDFGINPFHAFLWMSRIGKSLFTTKEEAESMLKEWLVKEEGSLRRYIDILVADADHLLSVSELPFLEEESGGRKFGELKTGDSIWYSDRTNLTVSEVFTKVMYEMSNRKVFDVGFTKFSAYNGSYSSLDRKFHMTSKRANNQLVKWSRREFLRVGDEIKDKISRYDRIIEKGNFAVFCS